MLKLHFKRRIVRKRQRNFILSVVWPRLLCLLVSFWLDTLCTKRPCLNGGTCTQIPNYYTCTCPAGYTGRNCESRKTITVLHWCLKHVFLSFLLNFINLGSACFVGIFWATTYVPSSRNNSGLVAGIWLAGKQRGDRGLIQAVWGWWCDGGGVSSLFRSAAT